ncbi:MAG: tRNA (5-methylaminomethyl-2-thiouridine)(34)-methyltransferase MnmD [Pseudomonadales bacterium]|nr:tRNA (5-methylaminomethyl-2-thiouridine)(34)-methyltransferase MnmD [Pseudomonadales bacterium]
MDPRPRAAARALMAGPVLATARLAWRDDQPYSLDFGDIYHAPDGAAEVARVFLTPSDFAARAQRLPTFRVGELGFGSGLNFVVAAAACLAAGARLHFWSFEHAPIAPDDFRRLATRRAKSHPLYAELARVYPPPLAGWHQRHLAGGRVRLSVFWGDAAAGLVELAALQRAPLDAWFLDGFAPDRNPALWSSACFEPIAALSAPGTTVATFTAAGRVRRALADVGFQMRRVDQRPHKRESLTGVFAAEGCPASSPPRRATVFGAGLAGASVARQLAEAGIAVTVHDPHPPGSARPAPMGPNEPLPGSHMPTTVLHGRLLADPGPAGRLRCHAYLFAAAFAARFDGFTPTGVLQLEGPGPRRNAPDSDPKIDSDPNCDSDPNRIPARLAAIAATWGDSGGWLEALTAEQARARVGWPVTGGGLWFADAGVVTTPTLCRALLDHPNIELIDRAIPLPDAPPDDDAPMILACGAAIRACAPARYLELAAVHGQLDAVTTGALPRAPVVGNGYLAPAAGRLTLGATYEYRPWSPERATAANLAQLGDQDHKWFERARGTRVTSSDRNAVAGPLYDADGRPLAPLYVSTGHGSMGNVSSHFSAALVSALITGDAPPLSPDLVDLLSPLRFRLRQARRGYRFGASATDQHA